MSKVCICAIVKNENKYIREWIGYHLMSPFSISKIFIYDNNDKDGEVLSDVILDYIDSGVVEIIDYRGYTRKYRQLEAYTECYNAHKDEFDWFTFIDIDEFLAFDREDISLPEFLDRANFKGFEMIHLMWLIYGDSGFILNNGKPCLDRFTLPSNYLRTMTKFFCRGGMKEVIFGKYECGLTLLNPDINCCFSNGLRKSPKDWYNLLYKPMSLYIKHFYTKSLEEWIKRRTETPSVINTMHDINSYFLFNERTPEKTQYIREYLKLNPQVLTHIYHENPEDDYSDIITQ